MNNEIAQVLLMGLLERANQSAVGTISSVEKSAIEFALQSLSGNNHQAISSGETTNPAVSMSPDVTISAIERQEQIPSFPVLEPVKLNLESLALKAPEDPDFTLCLDFGTAMSKAFAIDSDYHPYEIRLGERAGHSGYAVPSSLFIKKHGLVIFGQDAIDESLELVDSGRQRLDSIKGYLSLRAGGDLDSDACVLKEGMNPVQKIRLTEGDLVRIYLAYLTDLAITELVESAETSRYVARRFAHPCWSDQQKAWAEPMMCRFLAQAQILADTFHGQWKAGIQLEQIKSALDQVKALDVVPTWLIAEGVPEPVAAAAGVMADGHEKREPFMVIDVGAGTTDFGVFVIRESEDPEFSKVFQIPNTACGVKQAGDHIDQRLLKFIQDDAQIDSSHTHLSLIVADLKRKIRALKERLFTESQVTYVLADSTTGTITLDDFLKNPKVSEFTKLIESEMVKCLEIMSPSWLQWISKTGLKVVLTGGGAQLPMIKGLASGPIIVKGHNILRKNESSLPAWVRDDADYLVPVFDQLAVAIGGAEPELPEVIDGPEHFMGGGGRTMYVAGNAQISGN